MHLNNNTGKKKTKQLLKIYIRGIFSCLLHTALNILKIKTNP